MEEHDAVGASWLILGTVTVCNGKNWGKAQKGSAGLAGLTAPPEQKARKS
jgi:hypothetical protein